MRNAKEGVGPTGKFWLTWEEQKVLLANRTYLPLLLWLVLSAGMVLSARGLTSVDGETSSNTQTDLKWFTSLGVGGMLAGVIFFYYRQDFLKERDVQRERIDRMEKREDRLLSVIEDSSARQAEIAEATRELSGSISALRQDIARCPKV